MQHKKAVTTMVSNLTLAKIAAVGGVVTITTGYYIRGKIEDGIKKSEYYKEALKTLRNHKGVVSVFGEPIKDGRLNLGDSENNFCDSYRAQFQVPVRGPDHRGTLHLWAERETHQHDWNVYKLELEVQGNSNKRIVLRNQPSDSLRITKGSGRMYYFPDKEADASIMYSSIKHGITEENQHHEQCACVLRGGTQRILTAAIDDNIIIGIKGTGCECDVRGAVTKEQVVISQPIPTTFFHRQRCNRSGATLFLYAPEIFWSSRTVERKWILCVLVTALRSGPTQPY
uniref:Uncharacterized protein n=1 Tax=Timema genevievae TaxID=629358 RepID=A0A7R9K4D3_TIMGE|nr:unnamed protein product [Timema genevievae]